MPVWRRFAMPRERETNIDLLETYSDTSNLTHYSILGYQWPVLSLQVTGQQLTAGQLGGLSSGPGVGSLRGNTER